MNRRSVEDDKFNKVGWNKGEGGEGKDRKRKWKIILIVLLKKKEME